MIQEIKSPVWDKINRVWIVDYVIKDSSIGVYTQRMTCEALVSAERCIAMVKQQKEKERQ